MFTSFSSLIPNFVGGQNNGEKKGQTPTQQPFTPDEDDDEESKQLGEEDKNSKNASSKKTPSETFIFVRPPPSKTNHPLNLQVQLVPPQSRPPGGVGALGSHTLEPRKSIDSFNPADTNTDLTRVSSNRSDNGYMSTTSISSTASTTSTSSSRRMIIPLYSLQAHNMLTNVIVDAGTDARIAKFTKRGMELVDLAVLEPIEVWPTTTAGAVRQSAAIDGLPTGRDSLQLPSATTGGGAHPYGDGSPAGNRSGQHLPELTPSSSRHSVSSAGHSLGQHQTAAVPQAAAVPEPPAVTTPKRNIFGKLFNKNKDRSSKPSSTSSLASTSSMPSIALRSESALTTPTNSPLPQSHIPGHSRATSIATPTPTSSSLAVTKPVSNRHSIISLAPAPPSPAGSRVDLPSDPHHGDASLPPGVPGSTGTGPDRKSVV